MKLELSKNFKERLQGKFGHYEFEVGILTDKPHRGSAPKKKGIKNVAGGPSRYAGKKSGGTVAEVSSYLQKSSDYLQDPFKKKSSDIIKFMKEFWAYAWKTTESPRLTNLVQAIVRNPLARGDYGPNKASTIRTKGFDRFGIDSAQLFNNIKCRVKRV